MAYEEYRPGPSPSRRPAHIRAWDWLRDLRRRFRTGLLLLFIVAALACKWALGRVVGRSGASPAPPMAAGPLSLPVAATGAELAALAAKREQRVFMARTNVDGIDGEVLVFVDDGKAAQADPSEPLIMNAEQIAAFDYFKAAYSRNREEIADAMLAAFQRERAELERHVEQMSFSQRTLLKAMGGTFPDIAATQDFVERLDGPTLHIAHAAKDGCAYATLCFTPNWTVDPFGAILHRDRVVWAGSGADYEDPLALDGEGDSEAESARPRPEGE